MGGCNFRTVRKALFGGMKFKQTLKGGEEAPQEDVRQRTFQAEGLPDAKSPWRARVMFASGTAKHVHGGSEASEAGSREDPGEGARGGRRRDCGFESKRGTGHWRFKWCDFQMSECYENHPRRYDVLGKCFSSCWSLPDASLGAGPAVQRAASNLC